MTFFFCSILFRFPGGIFFFQPHILMFSCLHTFLCSHVSTFSWFLCLHMFSCSLVPTRSLVLSSLHVLVFSWLHMSSCSITPSISGFYCVHMFSCSLVSFTHSRALLSYVYFLRYKKLNQLRNQVSTPSKF